MNGAFWRPVSSREAAMRRPRALLSNEELAALIASSAQVTTLAKTGLRSIAARLLKRLADRIGGQKMP